MKKFIAILLVIIFGSLIIFSSVADASVWVKGYFRSNGTYVQGHYRSSPDGNPYTNWSFPGNINPYTGKVAPGNPSTYLNNYYGNRMFTPRAPTFNFPSYQALTYRTPTFNFPSYQAPTFNFPSYNW